MFHNGDCAVIARRSYSSLRPKRGCFIFLHCISLAIVSLICLRPKVPLLRIIDKSGNGDSYVALQQCVDEYTSNGAWNGSTWRVADHPATCRFQHSWTDDDLAAPFGLVKVGFMGDSTTRSDLRAWIERFKCPRTNLDEAQVFQRKKEGGGYLCHASEQSINISKCGVPPIINITNCPSGVEFRYFYKIYPWTALDQWYLSQQPNLFQDIDVLVISLGRWFIYYPRDKTFNVTDQLDTFLVELKKVYSGVILYQSEYAKHLAKPTDGGYHPVPCTPRATCGDCGGEALQCTLTDETPRPQSDVEMRSVLERHRILYLDRWNVTKTLPLEHFQPWYCHNGTFARWFCSHHLGVVGMQNLRLIANVVHNLFATN